MTTATAASPLRLVLDTNVVLDLLLFADPRVAALADWLAAGRAGCIADAATIAELARVLDYPALQRRGADAAALLGKYRALARPVAAASLLPQLPRCRDADDQIFVELAVRAAADALVTRDRALLALHRRIARIVPGLRILTPERLIASYADVLQAPRPPA